MWHMGVSAKAHQAENGESQFAGSFLDMYQMDSNDDERDHRMFALEKSSR